MKVNGNIKKVQEQLHDLECVQKINKGKTT